MNTKKKSNSSSQTELDQEQIKQWKNENGAISPIQVTKLSEKVYKLLVEKNKPLKTDDIAFHLGISKRSARYAVNLLFDAKNIIKIPDLQDLRTSYYILNTTQ